MSSVLLKVDSLLNLLLSFFFSILEGYFHKLGDGGDGTWYLSVEANKETVQTVCTGLGTRSKEYWDDQVGSLHSSALAEARGSSKPQAHLDCLLRRPNQNQIIPPHLLSPSLSLSFGPERNNYCYAVEEALGVPGS